MGFDQDSIPNLLDFRLSFAHTFARLTACGHAELRTSNPKRGIVITCAGGGAPAPLKKEGHMLPLTKRQREILDYLNEFIQQHGYAPSLEEIGRRFGLSSLATVHKHLTNLQDKGFIKRAWNRSRSVEMVPTKVG